MRIIGGLILITIGAVALAGAGIGGGFGERHLWLVFVGGGAIVFGIGMLIRGAMRFALFALAGVLLIVGLVRGLFDLF